MTGADQIFVQYGPLEGDLGVGGGDEECFGVGDRLGVDVARRRPPGVEIFQVADDGRHLFAVRRCRRAGRAQLFGAAHDRSRVVADGENLVAGLTQLHADLVETLVVDVLRLASLQMVGVELVDRRLTLLGETLCRAGCFGFDRGGEVGVEHAERGVMTTGERGGCRCATFEQRLPAGCGQLTFRCDTSGERGDVADRDSAGD